MKKGRKRKRNKYKRQIKEITITKEIFITDFDRIIYTYKKDEKGKYTEVSNTSYEARIENRWVTIVRYDSTHGFLHRHTKISYLQDGETTDTEGVIKQGNHHVWLTWALRDLTSNFTDYRSSLLKRSGMVDKYDEL